MHKEVGYEGVDWIHLTRMVGPVAEASEYGN
jgi:hypothetical protein